MRELRTQSGGKPLRTLYIFDPYRTAILLIGGDKTGNDRWYEQFVPAADRIYHQYLEEIRKEDSGREREHFEKAGQEFGAVCERFAGSKKGHWPNCVRQNGLVICAPS
jgi:hypothetical protein